MRDLFVFAVVLGVLPFVLSRPYIGVLLWSWLAYMNPHRLCWGAAFNFPFSQYTALVLLFSIWRHSELDRKIPWTRETVLMVVFLLWMMVTSFNAIYPELAWMQFDKVWKIFLITFVTMMLFEDKQKLNVLVYLVTASLAFYGVKGGIFVISTGGAHMVLGPPKSFLKTHGEIGMALAMTIPFIRYIQLTFAVPGLLPAEIQRFIIGSSWQKLIHIGLTAAMFLTAAAILGTHSRGAMLAAIATGVTILWKGRNKLAIALALALAVPFSLSLMPEEWFERMDTVTMDSEKQDASTTGRINAWWMGFNMANDRFLGGGFNCFRKREFAIYAPNPASVHEAHNNFIEVLAEHGWVGFGIFFVLGLFTWMKASSVARKAKKRADTRWLTDLTTMCQVSIAAYVVSGMFIGQAYFDLYYHVVAFVVLADALLKKELARQTEPRNVLDNSARARSGSWAAYGGASRG